MNLKRDVKGKEARQRSSSLKLRDIQNRVSLSLSGEDNDRKEPQGDF